MREGRDKGGSWYAGTEMDDAQVVRLSCVESGRKKTVGDTGHWMEVGEGGPVQ